MITEYLFKKEFFIKSREKHFRTQKFTLFTFFKYLLDTHFQKQLVVWFVIRHNRFQFIHKLFLRISSTYCEEYYQ